MEPRFLSELIMLDDNGLPYTLYQALLYRCQLLNTVIEVPRKFKTDLASIPRGLWNVLPKSAKYDKAAVVHDFLYGQGKTGNRFVTRQEADAVLREAMKVCGVGPKTCFAIYWGVRVGGVLTWRNYRKNDKE